MKERPILFSAPMVRAILAGTKTQTRRVVSRELKHPGWTSYTLFGPSQNNPQQTYVLYECGPDYPDDEDDKVRCPYADRPGDRLWVREAFTIGYPVHPDATEYSAIPWTGADPQRDGKVFYRASFDEKPDEARMVWRPSIHMPRWASRITLEVTDVRVERLQDISPKDAIAEGLTFRPGTHGSYGVPGLNDDNPLFWRISPVDAYMHLWESINGPGSWDANPWVWVVEFRRANG